jgi:hypothetical protein
MRDDQVFISYSHDSDEHRETVLRLAERLRQDGLDAQLDQYVEGTPEEGWPRWMLDRLDEAAFVLVVCTATYYRRFRGHEEPGRGKGADWEGALITQEIYDARSKTVKFVPVLLSTGQERFIPEPLRKHTHYELTSEKAYQDLYTFLRGKAGVQPAPLGDLKPLSKRTAQPLTFPASLPAQAPTPIDHARIDKVQAQFSGTKTDVADQIYASLLDSFIENCLPSRWSEWASRAIELQPIWSAELVDGSTAFDVAVRAAIWPHKHDELERSFQTLASVLREARETFLRHAIYEEKAATLDRPMLTQYRGVKFYKEGEWNPERYQRLLADWRAWQNKSQALVFEATRAANWLADCARRFINPAFFAVEGKFRLFSTVLSDIPGDLWIPEYTELERKQLPEALPTRFENYRELFPFRLGPDD